MVSIVQSLVSGMDDFFSVRSAPGTPCGKGQGRAPDKAHQSSSDEAVTKEQAESFKNAVGGALTHLGQAVDDRFVAVGSRVGAIESKIQAAETEIQRLKGELQTVKEELKSLKFPWIL